MVLGGMPGEERNAKLTFSYTLKLWIKSKKRGLVKPRFFDFTELIIARSSSNIRIKINLFKVQTAKNSHSYR